MVFPRLVLEPLSQSSDLKLLHYLAYTYITVDKMSLVVPFLDSKEPCNHAKESFLSLLKQQEDVCKETSDPQPENNTLEDKKS